LSHLGEIDALLIEHACTRLVHEFAEALDTQQFEQLRELFTPDATFYRPAEPDVAIRGIDAIIGSYRTRLQGYRSLHLCTNVLIRATSSDSASGTTRILFKAGPVTPETPPGAGIEPTLEVLGGFEDRFVLTDRGWRFSERRGRLHFQSS
jgi:hypothetical protein